MLAPLKNRSLIEQEVSDSPAQRIAQLLSENLALKLALRQSRQSQKRSTTRSANRILAQTGEISRLESLLTDTKERLAALESGQVIIELGRKLMQIGEMNDQLVKAAHRIWSLDKTICAAHAECERLSRERDDLACQFGQRTRARYLVAERPTGHLDS